MIFLTDRLKSSPILSERIKGYFTWPHLYLADGVKDFLEEKENIIPTPWYKIPATYMVGDTNIALIIISSCNYEQKFPVLELKPRVMVEREKLFLKRRDRFAELSRAKSLVELQETMLKWSPEEDQYIEATTNGRIYDSTGSINVRVFKDLESGLHGNALIAYAPERYTIELISITNLRVWRKKKEKELSLQEYFQALPQRA